MCGVERFRGGRSIFGIQINRLNDLHVDDTDHLAGASKEVSNPMSRGKDPRVIWVMAEVMYDLRLSNNLTTPGLASELRPHGTDRLMLGKCHMGTEPAMD